MNSFSDESDSFMAAEAVVGSAFDIKDYAFLASLNTASPQNFEAD
jgi:hypothetical protein